MGNPTNFRTSRQPPAKDGKDLDRDEYDKHRATRWMADPDFISASGYRGRAPLTRPSANPPLQGISVQSDTGNDIVMLKVEEVDIPELGPSELLCRNCPQTGHITNDCTANCRWCNGAHTCDTCDKSVIDRCICQKYPHHTIQSCPYECLRPYCGNRRRHKAIKCTYGCAHCGATHLDHLSSMCPKLGPCPGCGETHWGMDCDRINNCTSCSYFFCGGNHDKLIKDEEVEKSLHNRTLQELPFHGL
jgi:hypothetical protein